MFVPGLRTNSLSVSVITDCGFNVIFWEKDAVVVDKKNKLWARADRIGNFYYIRQCQDVVDNAVKEYKSKRPIDSWHEKLGHVNEQDLKLMTKNGLIYGMKFGENEKLLQCEVWARKKRACKPFPKSNKERTKDLLEIVHTDVCGPIHHESFGRKQCFVTFIDNKSRFCVIRFIKNESEVLDVFKSYKVEAATFTGNKIKFLQSDNGLEYVNREFTDFLKMNGIQRRLTVLHTPHQNDVAERINRTLVEMA